MYRSVYLARATVTLWTLTSSSDDSSTMTLPELCGKGPADLACGKLDSGCSEERRRWYLAAMKNAMLAIRAAPPTEAITIHQGKPAADPLPPADCGVVEEGRRAGAVSLLAREAAGGLPPAALGCGTNARISDGIIKAHILYCQFTVTRATAVPVHPIEV